jgi:hypothetical protein
VPSTGLPYGISGSPWTNNLNSEGGAVSIGAVFQGEAGLSYVTGDVLGPTSQKLFAKVGTASALPIIPIQQSFSCAGLATESVTVSGDAVRQGKTIKLSNVEFQFTNPLGELGQVTATSLTVTVPDPSATDARYTAGSAQLDSGATGWSAGHNAQGIFAEFSDSSANGPLVVNPGDTVFSPPLGASYKSSGPAGTTISWLAGPISFTVSAPAQQSIVCLPASPVNPIASITE